MVIALAVGAFISTLLGGLFALRFQDKLHLILGFSAGSVIGVAFFDLLPEAMEAGRAHPASSTSSMIAVGFLLYLVINRIVLVYSSDAGPDKSRSGNLGVATLSIHSCIDGIAIGLAFQVSAQVGLIVSVAVLCHDFSDGINTVNIAIGHGIEKKTAFRWLLVDAVAPVLGAVSTLFFSIPQQQFGRVLALFCGFFFYIGASDLLPESQHAHPTRLTTVVTLMGVGLLYIVIRLVTK